MRKNKRKQKKERRNTNRGILVWLVELGEAFPRKRFKKAPKSQGYRPSSAQRIPLPSSRVRGSEPPKCMCFFGFLLKQQAQKETLQKPTQTNRQTDRQAGRQASKQTNKQANTHTTTRIYIYIYTYLFMHTQLGCPGTAPLRPYRNGSASLRNLVVVCCLSFRRVACCSSSMEILPSPFLVAFSPRGFPFKRQPHIKVVAEGMPQVMLWMDAIHSSPL